MFSIELFFFIEFSVYLLLYFDLIELYENLLVIFVFLFYRDFILRLYGNVGCVLY